jgi:hypothetical protein
MSRQGKTPRATRARTTATQISAAELAWYRAAYDGMSPDDPDFETFFGAAQGAAATIEANMRRISRPDGSSRRAAAGRFVIAYTAREETGSTVLPVHEVVQPPQIPIGAVAMAGLDFEPAR